MLYHVLLEKAVLGLEYHGDSQKVVFGCWHASFLILVSFRGTSHTSEWQVKQARLQVC